LAGQELSQEELDECSDAIADLVMNESEAVDGFSGLGSYDAFPINVMQFGDVYWIEAPEFDDIGYFSSKQEAMDAAEFNYEPFITARREAKEKGELED
jgi:hypothetical protein